MRVNKLKKIVVALTIGLGLMGGVATVQAQTTSNSLQYVQPFLYTGPGAFVGTADEICQKITNQHNSDMAGRWLETYHGEFSFTGNGGVTESLGCKTSSKSISIHNVGETEPTFQTGGSLSCPEPAGGGKRGGIYYNDTLKLPKGCYATK